MNKFKCIIIHNIISPYKTLLFNALNKTMEGNFKVLYLSETENRREWQINKKEIKFSFEIIFKGRIEDINPIVMSLKVYKRLNFYNSEIIIIGGYNYLACWSALIWAKIHKKKVIVIIESHYLDKPRNIIKENIKKLFVSNCDRALVPGIRHKKYAISLGISKEKIYIVKGVGGINISLNNQKKIKQLKSKKDVICKKLNIPYHNFLFVGRFSPEKNIIFLLNAFKKVKNEDSAKNWGLILVGNGPQRKEIENYIKEKKMKNIFLPGFIQKEELPFYYALADVFVLPSTSETWGLVVNEAMACGLPVLVSNKCGCYPDIINEGENGFSFNPLNDNELLEFMKNICYGKYNLKTMGKASLKIIKEYSSEEAAEIYKNAVNFVNL